MRRKISASVDGGTSGPVKRAQTGSEDPHRHEQIFSKQSNINCYFMEVELNRFYYHLVNKNDYLFNMIIQLIFRNIPPPSILDNIILLMNSVKPINDGGPDQQYHSMVKAIF